MFFLLYLYVQAYTVSFYALRFPTKTLDAYFKPYKLLSFTPSFPHAWPSTSLRYVPGPTLTVALLALVSITTT